MNTKWVAGITLVSALVLGACGGSTTSSTGSSGSSGSTGSTSTSSSGGSPSDTPNGPNPGDEQTYPYPQIAKEDDGPLKGNKITGSACIFQFDAVTGTSALLAEYTYDSSLDMWNDNVQMELSSSDVGKGIYQGDIVTYHGYILGSTSYDTQSGGNTTVPDLAITSMSVTGHGCA
jgi:hypothetical protein